MKQPESKPAPASPLDDIGGEPLQGSGFENEEPDMGFTGEAEDQDQTSAPVPPSGVR
jgi:hypothetical protein